MNVEVVQKRLWEQSQQHRKHRESDTPLFPVDRYEGRIRNLMDLTAPAAMDCGGMRPSAEAFPRESVRRRPSDASGL